MTSNAGSREMSAGTIGFWESGASARAIDARQKVAQQRSKQAIERVFSPEFRNRLDAIVPFGPLSPAVMETIVEKFILQLEAQLAERRVAFALEPDARQWLADKGYDPTYGARPLARVIQTEVRDPLTDEILFGRLEHGGTVTITLKDDKLEFRIDASAPPRTSAPVNS
jgi:ATP-dependent Clp protease ATP-binding subunit ClpA